MSLFRSSLQWFHTQNHGEKQNRHWKLVKYNFRDCWQLRFLMWSMPLHSKGGHEHAVCLCEGCNTVAQQWAGALVFVFKKLLKSEMIKASSQEPQQVTKPGFPVATHKQSRSCFHIWRKQDKNTTLYFMVLYYSVFCSYMFRPSSGYLGDGVFI
jgi:hypothetical protein